MDAMNGFGGGGFARFLWPLFSVRDVPQRRGEHMVDEFLGMNLCCLRHGMARKLNARFRGLPDRVPSFMVFTYNQGGDKTVSLALGMALEADLPEPPIRPIQDPC